MYSILGVRIRRDQKPIIFQPKTKTPICCSDPETITMASFQTGSSPKCTSKQPRIDSRSWLLSSYAYVLLLLLVEIAFVPMSSHPRMMRRPILVAAADTTTNSNNDESNSDTGSSSGNSNSTECEIGPDGTCLVSKEVDDGMEAVLPGMTIKSQDDDGISMVDTGFGVDQQSVGEHRTNIIQRFREIQQYMNDRVLKASTDDVLSTVASECQLRHELCTFWAVIGECEANPGMFYVLCQCSLLCTIVLL